ncbi:thermonuclease family protein [Pelagibius sp.]|uniref:thermonuclease family protein n=1 Tax=Pelagibius sp. TaxID=1931238 RepID=UPI003B50724C
MMSFPTPLRLWRLLPALALTLAVTAMAAAPAAAQVENPVEGRGPQVIDTATLDFAGRQVRLFGLQGIAEAQSCSAGTRVWACGREALWAARNRIANHWVHCRPVPGAAQAASAEAPLVCDLGGRGGPELNAWLVEQGWALADRAASAAYADHEDAARAAGQGVWRSR